MTGNNTKRAGAAGVVLVPGAVQHNAYVLQRLARFIPYFALNIILLRGGSQMKKQQ